MSCARRPTTTAFLEQVAASRGKEVAQACTRILERTDDAANVDLHDVLQAALDEIDTSIAKTGAVHHAGTRRCDS